MSDDHALNTRSRPTAPGAILDDQRSPLQRSPCPSPGSAGRRRGARTPAAPHVRDTLHAMGTGPAGAGYAARSPATPADSSEVATMPTAAHPAGRAPPIPVATSVRSGSSDGLVDAAGTAGRGWRPRRSALARRCGNRRSVGAGCYRASRRCPARQAARPRSRWRARGADRRHARAHRPQRVRAPPTMTEVAIPVGYWGHRCLGPGTPGRRAAWRSPEHAARWERARLPAAPTPRLH